MGCYGVCVQVAGYIPAAVGDTQAAGLTQGGGAAQQRQANRHGERQAPSPVRRSWTAASPPGLKTGNNGQVRCRTVCRGMPGASGSRRQCGASCGAQAGPGHPWGHWQMGGQGLQRSPQPLAGRGEQLAPTGAVQVATPSSGSCQRQGVSSIGFQEAARASTQGLSPAACITVAYVH
ncbi:hypothetical protein HaLaN_23196 [Haematococcus lacustris]|uniref:Uncharacterized protein n=1 Tax=Haematococcus lacustris TaxID=44745 RepID=A0A699ZVR7_HAELA|nr:hypothetical protein HaLaN_23196 [Haematococcus lacustris]